MKRKLNENNHFDQQSPMTERIGKVTTIKKGLECIKGMDIIDFGRILKRFSNWFWVDGALSQTENESVSANHSAASKYQFEVPSKWEQVRL